MYEQLADMGFGLKELKLLRNTIFEIGYANNIPRENAVSKFFNDIEQQYDDKPGFEAKVEKLQAEVNKLYQQEMKLHAYNIHNKSLFLSEPFLYKCSRFLSLQVVLLYLPW